jgi:2-(1,2-epoxy-1,2-dihydrophenyl)acetyl-CoA isomerase
MSPIQFETIGHVAKISLNRPNKYNSFTRELALALQEALKSCRDEPQIRAIYITGMGKAFCAGQDLGEVTQEDAPSLSTIIMEHLNPIIRLIREIEKPIVAAVNGVAAGAGANLALACDICVASDKASFIQAFSKIGLIPDSGGTFFLPRLVGMARATAYMMLGEKISAKEAVEVGMIYRSYPDKSFAKDSWALVEQLAQMPTRGLGLTKRALNKALYNDLEHQLEIEEQLQVNAGETTDYHEGVAAFLEKRQPKFTGE